MRASIPAWYIALQCCDRTHHSPVVDLAHTRHRSYGCRAAATDRLLSVLLRRGRRRHGISSSIGLLPSFVAQGLVFIGTSLFCVVLLRKPLLAKFHLRKSDSCSVDSLVGQTAQALETIAPQAFGKVELRGASWSALNIGSTLIAADVRCRVEKVEGLTLHVRV